MPTDASAGVVEMLRLFTNPGDRVVINPPVYSPFFDWLQEARTELQSVPLGDRQLDLPALDRAFATKPAAYVLCNPHNPVGRVHTYEELAAVVERATRHGVPVISDEIHAPLALPGATYTPFLTVPGAGQIGVSVVSPSKAFNLAASSAPPSSPRRRGCGTWWPSCLVTSAGAAGTSPSSPRSPPTTRATIGWTGCWPPSTTAARC
jgi:cystathionine beta-lyase